MSRTARLTRPVPAPAPVVPQSAATANTTTLTFEAERSRRVGPFFIACLNPETASCFSIDNDARPYDQLIQALATICDLVDPSECWKSFKATGYAPC